MHTYTLEPGRTIVRDGLPFFRLQRIEQPPMASNGYGVGSYACTPVELDEYARRIVALLNAQEKAQDKYEARTVDCHACGDLFEPEVYEEHYKTCLSRYKRSARPIEPQKVVDDPYRCKHCGYYGEACPIHFE